MANLDFHSEIAIFKAPILAVTLLQSKSRRQKVWPQKFDKRQRCFLSKFTIVLRTRLLVTQQPGQLQSGQFWFDHQLHKRGHYHIISSTNCLKRRS